MRFEETKLAGVVRIVSPPHIDERGAFHRLFDRATFEERGLVTTFTQQSYATNVRRGVLRGLHYQAAPHAETKVIRCTRGAVYDVLLDIRPDSSTYGSWEAHFLRAIDFGQLYVPVGIAHGYQTLTDDAEMHYLISSEYVPEAARGFHFDSPALAIRWPVREIMVSERDRSFPEFERE